MNNILSVDIDWVQNFTQTRLLAKKVSKMINNKEFKTIQVGSTHDEIIETIDLETEPCYIVNVDDHHDLQYESEVNNCQVSTPYRACNWLGIELCNHRVTGCTWIANLQSSIGFIGFAQSEWEDPIGNKEIDLIVKIKYDLDEIDNFKYKSLFLCDSPSNIQGNWSAHGAWLTIMSVIDTLEKQKILRKEGNFYYYES